MTDANFTPEFDPADVNGDYGQTGGDITVPTFHELKPFRFWCQKALPLVYDDSLSYYEVLCKVVNYLNNMMTALTTGTGAITQFAQQFVINQQFLNNMAEKLGENTEELEDYINDRMDDFTTAYNELQNYVNEYFNNLDVQEEIDTKLDEMAESGQFNVLFDPVIQAWMTEETEYINSNISTQNSTIAEQNGRISVLEGRMDTFASLPSGSTSGNAELLDIRTNFLGETFGSAGDAVRASDYIASGFSSQPIIDELFSSGTSYYAFFDTTRYKGGKYAIILNNFNNSLLTGGGLVVNDSPSFVSGSPEVLYLDSDETSGHAHVSDYLNDYVETITETYSDGYRLLITFSIPQDSTYTYVGLKYYISLTGSITPHRIGYASNWINAPVDPTLSIEGDAADAKATGDAIGEVNERLDDGIANARADVNELGLFVSGVKDYTENNIYQSDGTTSVMNLRKSTPLISCSDYVRLYFLTAQFTDGTNTIATIAFFKNDKTFLSAIYPTANINGIIESKVDIPANAEYFATSWLTTRNEVPYVIGVRKNSSFVDSKEEITALQKVVKTIYDENIIAYGKTVYNQNYTYLYDGTLSAFNYRKSTPLLSCDECKYIFYHTGAYRTNDDIVATLAFFNANEEFISSVYPNANINGVVTGEAVVPNGAKYVCSSFVTLLEDTPYIIGVKDSLYTKLEDEIADLSESNKNAYDDISEINEALQKELNKTVNLNPEFTGNKSYNNNGDELTLGLRGNCKPIPCDGYDFIKYRLQQFNNALNHINVVTFFTDEMVYISGVCDTSHDQDSPVDGYAVVPSNAKYVVGAYKSTVASSEYYMFGVKSNGVANEIDTIQTITNSHTNSSLNIVNAQMTKSEFISAVNSYKSTYASLNLCSEASFRPLNDRATWEDIHDYLNSWFRDDVYKNGMTHIVFCERVNQFFLKRIIRFEDAKINTGTSRDFSINMTSQFSGSWYEPSAIVSDDGSKLYVYGAEKRIESVDGVNWKNPTPITKDDNRYNIHSNISLIDGIYYMTTTDNDDFMLYTSTDGLNFEYKGILFKNGQVFSSDTDYRADIYGNSYLLKESGVFYLFIEFGSVDPDTQQLDKWWSIHLCTCTDILQQNQDGTIGNWVIHYDDNPIISEWDCQPLATYQGSACNPDFAKGMDNRPIKHDGKWYMYLHGTFNGVSIIQRAYSTDLINWTVEGPVFDNRDQPTSGDNISGNADHCVIEFKNRTYLVYSWNINTSDELELKCTIDDRPFHEMLGLYP